MKTYVDETSDLLGQLIDLTFSEKRNICAAKEAMYVAANDISKNRQFAIHRVEFPDIPCPETERLFEAKWKRDIHQ